MADSLEGKPLGVSSMRIRIRVRKLSQHAYAVVLHVRPYVSGRVPLLSHDDANNSGHLSRPVSGNPDKRIDGEEAYKEKSPDLFRTED